MSNEMNGLSPAPRIVGFKYQNTIDRNKFVIFIQEPEAGPSKTYLLQLIGYSLKRDLYRPYELDIDIDASNSKSLGGGLISAEFEVELNDRYATKLWTEKNNKGFCSNCDGPDLFVNYSQIGEQPRCSF